MGRIGRMLVRLATILPGYGVACLAASAFLHFVAWPMLNLGPEETPWALLGGIVFSIPFVALFIAYFGFIPALLAILVAELAALRGRLYFALAGAGGGLFAIVLARQSAAIMTDAADGIAPPAGERALIMMPEVMAAVIGAGIVAGLVYWLIAGRGSGNWRGPTAPAPSGS
jgi:hypothetical protein